MSSYLTATLDEVKHRWTLVDLMDAHLLINMMDQAHARAAEEARR